MNKQTSFRSELTKNATAGLLALAVILIAYLLLQSLF
jgi:hypothetical protein